MSIRTVPSRDLARDVSRVKRLAAEGPVFITDRGRPAFVMLNINEYYELSGKQNISLLELMERLPRTDGIKFEAPHADVTPQIPEAG